MKLSVRNTLFAASLCAGLVVAGCASYYKITDPQSGKVYYSEDVETMSGGAVKVKDARTGSTVTLQNSEVKEIDSAEYKAGLAAPQQPAPAPAPAPTPSSLPTATPAPASRPTTTATPAAETK